MTNSSKIEETDDTIMEIICECIIYTLYIQGVRKMIGTKDRPDS